MNAGEPCRLHPREEAIKKGWRVADFADLA